MTVRLARRSGGQPYPCRRPWPADCFVQCGGSERTGFFFEAMPTDPATFLRGESSSGMEGAEDGAWQEYERIVACPRDHADAANFDKRGYGNGGGFCVACGMFAGRIFPPWESCHRCGIKTYYAQDRLGAWWCRACAPEMPEDRLTETQRWLRQVKAESQDVSDQEVLDGIREICERIVAGADAPPDAT